MPSAFLPKDFSAQRPVALIAGRGSYPVITAAAIRAAGVPLRLIAMDDETEPSLIASFPESERVTLNVGQVGKMLDTLKAFGAGYALMAGQVKPKKLFHGLVPDLKAASILFSLKRRNAETIFGAIAAEIEKLGVTLLDARAFIDDQLATAGAMTGKLGIDDEYVHVRFTFMVKKTGGADVTKGIGRAFIKEVSRQLEQDAPIWENKIHHNRPVLCDGDGEIALFRRWSRQFYPDWYWEEAHKAFAEAEAAE